MSINKYSGDRRHAVFLTLALLLCSSLFIAAYIPGCDILEKKKKEKVSGTVIARVGGSVLTLEDLQASIPPEYSDAITRDQNIHYVRQWINTELLYQEALRLRIDQEADIRARLEKMKKDLLSSEIISRGSMNSAAVVGEQEVREYYESNKDRFIREHNVVRYESVLVDDINLAWEIRRTATHETFRNAVKTHSKALHTVDLDAPVPVVALDAIPPVVRNAIAAAAVPSITGPYRSDEGFYILRVINKFEKGTTATLDEVRDEIVARLSNITQKGETERLIADIRSRADTEFNIDLIPGADVAPADGMSQD